MSWTIREYVVISNTGVGTTVIGISGVTSTTTNPAGGIAATRSNPTGHRDALMQDSVKVFIIVNNKNPENNVNPTFTCNAYSL